MGTSIYCNSSISDLLQNARECCEKSELKTKKGLAKYLGITYERLLRIESGQSKPEFELAMDWCDATGANLNKQAIKHIYGVGLPPTDPRLTKDINLQLMNYIKQAEEGIAAAKEIMNLQVTTRSWQMDEKKKHEYAIHAKEIFDTLQASQCVVHALEQTHFGIMEQIQKSWLQKAMSENVVIQTIDSLLTLTKAF
ncbi:helix-turn-helix domain-containing protein [Bacillus pseudomycoides]|uniref:Sporulation sigma factor-processing peptidase n=1 Tax=Bacillus pseudomycoides TaxID=64104 RepID=A0A2B6K509_9BACI|nr:helix-turn-helix transcriptional regulator [Bacillus pseudomycoides]PEA84733.1 sporulation sigma factor-processing peptidase [Bacillus pseudomycoides]PED71556.1 sporulation sigma factor-processing peptidase [Bacillus pseudomycoides]PEI40304.1 sporulation sigma factor-processing peptidase [Bacillus pseudomycoides]PEJ73229.1 sporulation sigma factor-processing peptidase [Bacillus pseudomycoides]PEM19801.1 sporulation sigma factor-processing peptidase [Bacillus pseudomycoides]